jgi:hypothetical protein
MQMMWWSFSLLINRIFIRQLFYFKQHTISNILIICHLK